MDAERWRHDPTPGIFNSGDLVGDRFRIVRLIGQGGMGAVYEARDMELGGHVALKTIRGETARDPRAIERFKQEIYLARKVTHPNVCRIFDLFYHCPGSPEFEVMFLTMELLRGETLADRLQTVSRLTPSEALPLVTQMAAALGAAHQAGIIHRDFKPANVVLVPSTNSDDPLRAVVTDFGLARASLDSSTALMAMTGAGDIVGTPAYMAPEQLDNEEITRATDLYALGLVMYEMVTGERPFRGDTPLAVAFQRLQAPPPSPREVIPDLDSRWDATIRRCLERRAADRFADAADVVRALAGESVRSRKDPLSTRRVAIAAIAVVLLAAGAAFLVLRVADSPEPPSAVDVSVAAPIKSRRSIAVLGLKNLSQRPDVAWLSTALAEMLTSELGAGEMLRIVPGEDVARVKLELALGEADTFGKETLSRIRANLGTDLVVFGSYVAVGQAADQQVRLDLRLQDTGAGETIASVTDTASETDLLRLVSRTGSVLREKLGLQELSAAQVAGVRASLPSSPIAARLYAEGLAKLRLSENGSARELLEKAVAAEPKYPVAHAALAAAWGALGYDGKAKAEARLAFELSGNLSREERLSIEGRYRQTAGEPDKAIEIYRTLFNFFPDSLDYGLRLAAVQSASGKGANALATIGALQKLPSPIQSDPRIDLAEGTAAASLSDFKRQQAVAARAVEKGNAQGARLLVAGARLSESEALSQLRQPANAIAAAQEAHRIYSAADDRAGVARALNRIAIVRRQQGALAEAMELNEQALATYRSIGDRSGVVTVVNNIANILRQQGRLPEAIKMHQESLAVSREIGDERREALALNNMAIVFRQQGNLSRAASMYEEALAIRRRTGEKSGIASTLGNIANVLSDQGNWAKAAEMHQEALSIWREVGDKSGQALTLSNLGFMFWPQGKVAVARKHYEESLAICREIEDRRGIARALTNLADAMKSQGELGEATKRFEEALAIWNELGEKRGQAFALAGLGHVFLANGDLARARKQYEGALSIQQTIKDTLALADTHLALAELSIEEGRSSEGERLARQAAASFRSQRMADGETTSYTVLARALLAQRKPVEAQSAVDRARERSRGSQNRHVLLALTIAEGRVGFASRRLALQKATEVLKATLEEATRSGLVDRQLEIRLYLGELETGGANRVEGRDRLAHLAKEADEKGFRLIARKAAVATS